jgi:hypothetical protein
MFSHIAINNFKSVRQLEFDPKRVNLFIGEPNTGKSNIVEALAFFSASNAANFKEEVRFKVAADLFFDQKVTTPIVVEADELKLSLTFQGGGFQGAFVWPGAPGAHFSMNFQSVTSWFVPAGNIHRYVFKPVALFQNPKPGVLNPPFGNNLVAVLFANEELRQRVGAVFKARGFRLQLKPTESELLISKDVNDEIYSYPWPSVSETLRRIVFFMAVLETNRDAILLLDEPEANTSPFYTKYLAERIALDETNQFFITTHNPYLLGSILAKAPADQVAVFVTYMENFETKLKPITGQRLTEVVDLSSDVFFNLEKLLTA